MLAKKRGRGALQLFVLSLSVGNVLYYISKTVLKNTRHIRVDLFFYHMSPIAGSLPPITVLVVVVAGTVVVIVAAVAVVVSGAVDVSGTPGVVAAVVVATVVVTAVVVSAFVD